MSRVDTALADARTRLADSPSPRLDAELLLAHATGRRRTTLHAWPEAELTSAEQIAFDQLIDRRTAGEPIAHLTGTREFWSLEFAITQDALIPRPETEDLVAVTLEHLQGARPRILDLGTGSGCIAIAIARERPDARVTAIEQSPAALTLARRNGERHHAEIEWLQGAWFEPVAARHFDAIVANPPYVASGDPHLQQGDVRFEPIGALDGGADGLEALRTIVGEAPQFLAADGLLAVEHGADQAQAVAALFNQAKFDAIRTHPDAAGWARVTTGRTEAQPSTT